MTSLQHALRGVPRHARDHARGRPSPEDAASIRSNKYDECQFSATPYETPALTVGMKTTAEPIYKP